MLGTARFLRARLRVAETPVFTEAVVARGKIERNPAMEALKRHPRNFFVVLGARLAENGLGYLFPVFGLNYVITTVGVPRAAALSALMLAFIIELFTIVGFAALSDRLGLTASDKVVADEIRRQRCSRDRRYPVRADRRPGS